MIDISKLEMDKDGRFIVEFDTGVLERLVISPEDSVKYKRRYLNLCFRRTSHHSGTEYQNCAFIDFRGKHGFVASKFIECVFPPEAKNWDFQDCVFIWHGMEWDIDGYFGT